MTTKFLPFSGIEDGEFTYAALDKKINLPMSQTHQTQSDRISYKLLIQKTTQVCTLLLMI